MQHAGAQHRDIYLNCGQVRTLFIACNCKDATDCYFYCHNYYFLGKKILKILSTLNFVPSPYL
jgi:hypothetical protein